MEETCAYHGEIKSDVDKLIAAMSNSQQWQSVWQTNLENMIDILRELKDEQKDLTKAVNEMIVSTHRDFVTKKELEDFKRDTREEIANVRKENLKAMSITFAAGGAVLAFIQWVISLIMGG